MILKIFNTDLLEWTMMTRPEEEPKEEEKILEMGMLMKKTGKVFL